MPCGGDCRSGKCLETGGHNMAAELISCRSLNSKRFIALEH